MYSALALDTLAVRITGLPALLIILVVLILLVVGAWTVVRGAARKVKG